jgi:hypothetical protein
MRFRMMAVMACFGAFPAAMNWLVLSRFGAAPLIA